MRLLLAILFTGMCLLSGTFAAELPKRVNCNPFLLDPTGKGLEKLATTDGCPIYFKLSLHGMQEPDLSAFEKYEYFNSVTSVDIRLSVISNFKPLSYLKNLEELLIYNCNSRDESISDNIDIIRLADFKRLKSIKIWCIDVKKIDFSNSTNNLQHIIINPRRLIKD